jgi:recombination protein RecA
MPSANAVRLQLESALAHRIPSALTPAPHVVRAVACVGIPSVDDLLYGGLPIGAITEIIGPESSGRTSLSLSFLAQVTQSGKVCAWVDVTSALHPESAAAAGVDLTRLLWVRCGVPPKGQSHPVPSSSFTFPKACLAPPTIKKGLHGGGCGGHPRMESKGLSDAIKGFVRPEAIAPRCAEPQRRVSPEKQAIEPIFPPRTTDTRRPIGGGKPWSRIEQALRVTDLLLQAGGFSSIVLDMGDLAPEVVSRIPLATWFRYRAAAERSQISILLLTQHACAKSSAGLVLRLQPGDALRDEATVFAGLEYKVGVMRERFTPTSNVIPLRKPPQQASGASWRARTAWTGSR